MIKVVSVSLVSVIVLSSCTSVNPYTGQQQISKTTYGAAIGGLLGAGIGALSASGKDRRKKALVGAGIGALTGGVVGHYMDKQEAELRQRLQSTGVSVTRNGNDLILNMPSDVTFATNQASIGSNFQGTLDSVGTVLTKYDKTTVDVLGHTDSTGARNYNYDLSQRRASSVASYLSSRGVQQQRLLTTGRGPDEPVASNDSTAGRAQNRRVTIRLEPLTQ